MKKILLFVALMTIATSSFAQFSYGVKGGLNLSSISNINNATENSSMKPSFFLGIFAEYTINDLIGVQPEIIYSRQGSFTKVDDGKMWMRANYINVPILAKIYLLENLSLDFGPQLGFLAGSKVKIESEGVSIKVDPKDLIGSSIKGFDFAIAMGLTYKIFDRVDVSARYNLGLTDIIKDNASNNNFKNGTLQIGAGYRF